MKLKAEREERIARSKDIHAFIEHMLVQKAVVSADGTAVSTINRETGITVRSE